LPTATVDGIRTRYEVIGSGEPLLMFAPGGFNSVMDNWTTQSVYSRVKPVDHLSQKYTCIIFDRREAGLSGGRVERVTWDDYVAQGKALLEHLDIGRAHLMGGCMGCPPVAAFGVAHPEMVSSMILYWPVGGPKYRLNGHTRFARHLAYVHEHGLDGVVALADSHDKSFVQDARIGPWGPVLRHDDDFRAAYLAQDVERYKLTVIAMGRTLLDRDTAPGAEPEDLMQLDIPALIVPGEDDSHTASAARYLQECLPAAEYWDVGVADQTEETVPARLLEFLEGVSSRG
jgi:pimeloyl-ACP methyl ester carboxylesterase